MATNRLDQELVERAYARAAKRLVAPSWPGQVPSPAAAKKASDTVRPGDNVALLAGEKYVSAAAIKLEHALKRFAVDPTGLVAIDLGASTGGFTDASCSRAPPPSTLLMLAMVVGMEITTDPRVVVMEKNQMPGI